MKITICKNYPWQEKNRDLVIFLAAKQKGLSKELKTLPDDLKKQIGDLFKQGDFQAALNENLLLYHPFYGRVLLIGLGEIKELNNFLWQQAVGTAVIILQNKKVANFSFYVPAALKRKVKVREATKFLVKGILVAGYQFNKFKSKQEESLPEVKEIYIGGLNSPEIKAAQEGSQEGEVLGEVINRARDYGNLPSSHATPGYLVSRAKELAKRYQGLSAKILHREDMKRLGMGGILGVSRGSKEEPAFIVLEWRSGKSSDKPICLVGKTITFDSGGISIKPSSKMDEMKFDMAGGGTVLGVLEAAASLGVKKNVVGLIPACENMPGGGSYKPGDILTTISGKTIEVLHTDAEGRIILADALGYAKQFKPKAVIDIATLTGACVVALGNFFSGLLGNNEYLIEKIKKASVLSGERVWQLPLHKEAREAVKSEIADTRNITPGFSAGVISAAAFLEYFTEEYPWAHLDIAGTAWDTKGQSWRRKGATGEGVHLLVEFLKK